MCCCKTVAPVLAAFLAAPALAQQGTTGPQAPTNAGVQPGIQAGRNQPTQPGPGMPLFQDRSVRRSLNITEQQTAQLNQLNERLTRQFREGVGAIGDVGARERAERIEQLQRDFQRDFFLGIGGILLPEQLERYRELDLQRQGLAAFDEPAVRKQLRPTAIQTESLRTLRDLYRQEVRQLAETSPTSDRETFQRHHRAIQRKYWDQVNDLLTPEQRKVWTKMVGEPFDFPPNAGPAAAPQPPQGQ